MKVTQSIPSSMCSVAQQRRRHLPTSKLPCRSSLEEFKQIVVNIIWLGVWQSMRTTRVDLQGTVLEEFDALMGTGFDGNDLIVVASIAQASAVYISESAEHSPMDDH